MKKVKNVTAKDEAEVEQGAVNLEVEAAEDEGEQAATEVVVEQVIIDDFQAEEPQNTAAMEVVVEEIIIDNDFQAATEEEPQDTVVDFSTIKVVSISNPGDRRKNREQCGPVPKEKQILG